MNLRLKRLCAVAAAAAVGLGSMIAGGTAQAASAANYAHSSANGWHRSSFDVAFQVRQMFSNSVDAYNQADASARNCDGCRNTAIAFQIVADARTPENVDAGNDASAVNIDCSRCQTLGVAYQFVMAKPTVLSWSDLNALYRIDFRLQMLRWSRASADDVAGQVSAMAGEVSSILANAGHGDWPHVHHYLIWRH
jgi:hypothetical protein